MKLKGSVTVFVMLILGLIIGMYLMGFQAPIVQYVETNVMHGEDQGYGQGTGNESELVNVSELSAGDLLKDIAESIVSPIGLAFIGATLAITIGLGLLGQGNLGTSILQVTIPAFILFIVANVFFFPVVGYVSAEGQQIPQINFLLTLIFNALLMLTIVSFVMGRD